MLRDDPSLVAIRVYDDGVRRAAAGPGGRHQITAFINPHYSPSSATEDSPTSRVSGRSRSQPVLAGTAANLESFRSYSSPDSTYYRMMDGPDVNVHMWYVILMGLRVGIVKDLYVYFERVVEFASMADSREPG